MEDGSGAAPVLFTGVSVRVRSSDRTLRLCSSDSAQLTGFRLIGLI